MNLVTLALCRRRRFRCWWVMPRSIAAIRCAIRGEFRVLQVGCGYLEAISGVLVLVPVRGSGDRKAHLDQGLPARGRQWVFASQGMSVELHNPSSCAAFV